MIYAYAICEPATAATPPRRRGLGGAALRVLRCDGLAAVYSRHRSLRPRPSPELVLGHEGVIEAVMARGPVLPLRFGTQLESEQQLTTLVSQRRDQLLRALDRVRGHVEIGVRVIPERAAPRAGAAGRERSGREHLLALARHQRGADRAARDLHAPLAALATASVVREHPAPPAVLVSSYLVDAAAVAEFRRRAQELAARHEGTSVTVTGPWPPYSFVVGQDE
jgi:hypothetical protein